MALQRTGTTPGSYEKPVEGIVDYGAFQRGFDENFNMEDVEKAVAEKKQKFKEKTDKIFKESDLATGSFLDDQGKIILNPSVDTTNNYKNVLLEGKSEYIDRKTTRERRKELEAQALGFNATNETVKYLVSSLNSGDAVNLRGSTVEELFEEQGITFEEFSESYNNGNFFPAAKKNDKGNIIYGAEVLDKNGQKKFIDLTGKINQTTIADKLAINAEPDVKKAITEYKAKGGKTFNETDLFKAGGTGNEVKRTRLVNQYKDGTYASAESQAKQFVTNKPDLARGLYADATINTDIYTEAEQEFINMGGFKYEGTRGDASNIYYIYAKQIEDDMGLSVSGGNYVITKEDGTTETIDPKSNRGKNITTQVDSKTTAAIKQTRDGISIKYLKNEFLGTVEDFYMQDKNVTFSTSDSEYTNNKSYYDNLFSEEIANGQTTFTLKKGAHYPKKDLYQTTKLAKEEEEKDPTVGKPSKSSIVEDRLFNISSNLNSTTFRFTNENQGGFVEPGKETKIDPGTLLQGFFSDTDGTKATITSAKVKNIGAEGKDKHVVEITYEAGGEDNVETFDLDETGRRKITERAYKGQFAGEKDIATDLATGEENYQIKRQAVQKAFKAAGKDVTMRRRLNVINNYKSDPSNPEVWNTLSEEDKNLLYKISNTSDLATAYKDFVDGQDFDNN